MVVSDMACFNMDPIEVITMSDFLSPHSCDLRVVPLAAVSVVFVSVVLDSGEVFQGEFVDLAFLITHFDSLDIFIIKILKI